ncbi:hypothetical protein JCM10212_000144 [Sporobolomyces blumeae]
MPPRSRASTTGAPGPRGAHSDVSLSNAPSPVPHHSHHHHAAERGARSGRDDDDSYAYSHDAEDRTGPGQDDGASPGGGSGTGKLGKKKSQRPSWSCTECTRRKIRCDRVVPGCNQCIKRGKVHLCRLEQDVDLGFGGPPPAMLPGPSTSSTHPGPSTNPTSLATHPRLATSSEYDAITRSVNVVRQRLCHLERVLRAFVPQSGAFDEHGQPLFGVNMDLLASMANETRDQSGTTEQGANGTDGYANGRDRAGVSVPPGRSGFDANGDDRNSRNDPRPDLSRQSTGGPYPLPPDPASLNRVRHEHDNGRQMAESDGEVEAAVTLEYLALGRDRKEDHFHRAELRRPSPEADDEPTSPTLLPKPTLGEAPTTPWPGAADPSSHAGLAGSPSRSSHAYPPSHPGTAFSSEALPSPALSEFLITYSLDRTCWQHSAVHVGQFRAEHGEFLSWGDRRAELVNQAWLALYFSMLCVGVKHMPLEVAREGGLTQEDHVRLPRVYFDAAIAALHRANFLSRHTVYAVQTIVIIVVSCQDVGGSDLIATLLACGIRIAQHLNIHRFASDQEWENRRRASGVDPKSQEAIKGLIQRELRKRLWYSLTIEDWLSIPFRRAYSISPTHFTTPLPTNCHDSDLSAGQLVHRSPDEPTIVSKILSTYQVATQIRRFFEHVNCSTNAGEPSYELCIDVDRQIRKIIEDGPGFLKEETPSSEAWVKHLRHYYIISVSHKLLICHRVFLGRSFRDPRYAYSRRAAIEAARSVIQELARGSGLPYQRLWTFPFHTIAASTTIILDIFQSSSSDPDTPNKRREVQVALEELRKMSDQGSQIASRGAQLLSTLLAEEAKHRRQPALASSSDARKRKASMSGEGERFGDVAKRVASSGRSSLGRDGSSVGSASSSRMVSPHLPSSAYPYFQPTLGTTHGGLAPPFDQQSPVDSHVSDGSLTQDAFDAILQGLSGYSGGTPGAMDGFHRGANGAGGPGYGSGSVGGGGGLTMSPGTAGEAATAEFWRTFDQTFEPSALEMLGGMGANGDLTYDTGVPTHAGGGPGQHLGFGQAHLTPW